MDPNFCKPLPPPPTYTSATNTPLTLSWSAAPALLKKDRASTQTVPRTQRQKRASFINLRHLYKRPASHSYTCEPYVSERPHKRVELGLGLGINDSSEIQNEEKSTTEQAQARRNAAQWIEERIWRYTSSGSVIRRWTLEILSWSVSAACMLAIIVILAVLEKKPIPKWPLAQTLSILSRVASAALILPVSEALGQLKWNWFRKKSRKIWDFEIFDNASRGPLGSALLLVRTKGRTLASLGAAVTLLALALDPFFQQVADFPQRWTIAANGSTPRVIIYAPDYSARYHGDSPITILDRNLDAVANSFFYENGTQPVFFGNGTRPDIPLSCPTSNCTWPPFETLGFCSSCQDVSPMLEYGCRTGPDDWTLKHNGGYESPKENRTMCGYFLNLTSSKPIFMSGYILDTNSSSFGAKKEALLARVLPLTEIPMMNPLYGFGSIHFKEIRNALTDFLLVSASNGSESVYRNDTPIAQECVLSLCVKTISSSYYWGSYQEEIIKTQINTTTGPWPWKTETVIMPEGEATYQDYLSDISIQAPDSLSNSSNSSLYGVSQETALNMLDMFNDFTYSSYTVMNASARPRWRYGTWKEGYGNSQDIRYEAWMPPNNISNHMARMATAMTNAIRSSPSREMISGPAYDIEIFVSVSWPWLTLPLLILALSAVFLVGTVMQTSKDKEDVGVWKTSAMATLMYGGLPEGVQEQLKQDSNPIGTPRTKAKKFKARLLPRQGWRLSGNHFSPVPAERSHTARPSEWV